LQHKEDEARAKLYELKTAGDEAKDVYQGVEKVVILVFEQPALITPPN
jgi:hypothetical protein